MFFLGMTEVDTEPFCDPAVLQVVSASSHGLYGCLRVVGPTCFPIDRWGGGSRRNCMSPRPLLTVWAWALKRAESGTRGWVCRRHLILQPGSLEAVNFELPCMGTPGAPHADSAGQRQARLCALTVLGLSFLECVDREVVTIEGSW